MAKTNNRRKISGTKSRMILALDKAGYKPTEIANALGVSRTTVYLRLHPDKYQGKLEYSKRYHEEKNRDPWELEEE